MTIAKSTNSINGCHQPAFISTQTGNGGNPDINNSNIKDHINSLLIWLKEGETEINNINERKKINR